MLAIIYYLFINILVILRHSEYNNTYEYIVHFHAVMYLSDETDNANCVKTHLHTIPVPHCVQRKHSAHNLHYSPV